MNLPGPPDFFPRNAPISQRLPEHRRHKAPGSGQLSRRKCHQKRPCFLNFLPLTQFLFASKRPRIFDEIATSSYDPTKWQFGGNVTRSDTTSVALCIFKSTMAEHVELSVLDFNYFILPTSLHSYSYQFMRIKGPLMIIIR